jgi:hypothetical protein
MSLSNYLETALLNHAFRGSAYSQPAGLYLALFTSDPGEAGGGTEVSGGSYARQSFSGSVAGDTFTATANIDFPAATANWGTVSHVGIFDAASGGNLLASGALAAARSIGSGDIFREASLTVSLD